LNRFETMFDVPAHPPKRGPDSGVRRYEAQVDGLVVRLAA